MLGRVLVNMIIIPAVILTLSNGIVNKGFANEDYIRNQFGETKEFNDGTYKGVLSISNIDVQTIKNGYYEKIDEQVLSFEKYIY